MDKEVLSILDVVMSEYSWTLEYTMRLPITILKDLYKLIGDRKREDYKFTTKLQTIAIGAALSGDGLELIDKVFMTEAEKEDNKSNSGLDEQAQKNQMKALWARMGKKPEDFDMAYSKGEVTF